MVDVPGVRRHDRPATHHRRSFVEAEDRRAEKAQDPTAEEPLRRALERVLEAERLREPPRDVTTPPAL